MIVNKNLSFFVKFLSAEFQPGVLVWKTGLAGFGRRTAGSFCRTQTGRSFIKNLKLLPHLYISHSPYSRTIYAPKGLRDSFAILKNCMPNGTPMIVMHQAHPIRRLPRAIHHPLTRNQITFTRNETAPPPYSILLPNGQNDMAASLKHCMPIGIPMIVMHQKAPVRTQAMPLIRPPSKNQRILPKSLIYLLLR